MTFWDSSALVPLLAREAESARMRQRYLADPEVVVWWGSRVECASAIARLEREGGLVGPGASEAFARLDGLAPSWIEIEPTDEVREVARRYVRAYPLRAADALQLAAAFITAERRPPTLVFLTLDDRLRGAAEKEGFRLD